MEVGNVHQNNPTLNLQFRYKLKYISILTSGFRKVGESFAQVW